MTNDRQLVGNHISGRMLNSTSMSWRDGRSLLAGKPPCLIVGRRFPYCLTGLTLYC